MMTIDTAIDMILTEYRNRMNSTELRKNSYGLKIEYKRKGYAPDSVIKLRDMTLLKEDEIRDIIAIGIKVAQNRFIPGPNTIRVANELTFKQKRVIMTMYDIPAANAPADSKPNKKDGKEDVA